MLFVVDYQVGLFGTHVGRPVLSDPYNRLNAAVLNLKRAFREWIHLNEVCRYDHTGILHTVVHYFCTKDQI